MPPIVRLKSNERGFIMSKNRKYSDEFRLAVVTDYLSGKFGGYVKVAQKYGIHHKAIQRWVALYKLYGAEGLCKTSGTFKRR